MDVYDFFSFLLFVIIVVVWVIIAELVPSRLQSKAMYLFLNTNWASNLVVGLITLPGKQLHCILQNFYWLFISNQLSGRS